MKQQVKIILITAFLFLGILESTSQKNYPTNTSEKFIDTLDSLVVQKTLNKKEGHFYAFDAKILKLRFAYQNKPYFLVELKGGKTLWIASMLKNEYLKEGRVIRLLGSVSAVQEQDEIAQLYNDKKYHLLMFAFLDWETKNSSTFEGGQKQAITWRDGEIPEPLKND
jgi:hypothetical protein